MITAKSLAAQLGSEVTGNKAASEQPLTSLASLDTAGAGQLSFLASAKYRPMLRQCGASALLIKSSDVHEAPESAALIVVPDPYLAYARVSGLFSREPRPDGHIHPSAVISPLAKLGSRVSIGAHVVIADNAIIGDDCEIGPGCVLGEAVRLGHRTCLKANVTLHYEVELGDDCTVHSGAVIGGDGFGYAPGSEGWQKIAQVGRVIIGNRVDIGSNATIDRGAIEDTIIADNVIIDNLVQLAHNVHLGAGSAMAAQSGIAGSTRVGSGCTIGGQAGLAGHIRIADGSHFTGQAMVTKGTAQAGIYSSGIPAMPASEWRKTVARLRRLEQIETRLKALERRCVYPEDSNNNEEDAQ